MGRKTEDDRRERNIRKKQEKRQEWRENIAPCTAFRNVNFPGKLGARREYTLGGTAVHQRAPCTHSVMDWFPIKDPRIVFGYSETLSRIKCLLKMNN